MTANRQRTGRHGEALAETYLRDHDYIIVDKNWRCSLGEIDLIARQDDTLVFVEVRTRHGTRLGSPEESITPAKQEKLVKLAYTYLSAMVSPPADWRIDVIAIVLDNRGHVMRLAHLPAAVGE